MLFLGERKEGEQMCKRKNKRKKKPQANFAYKTYYQS